MRPAEFDYRRADTVEDAIAALGSGAKVLAGGHSLLPAMKLRISTPAALVDIGRIAGLDAIEPDGDGVRIGALARHAAVAASDVVRSVAPALAEGAGKIGDPQVRARGTIGGSLAHADPGADYPTLVRALGATIVAQGPGGEREIAADDFLVDVFTTSLGADELITAVRVPAAKRSAYLKHRHPASGYAVVGVAAVVRDDGVRVAVGGATASPVVVDAATADEAAARVAEAISNPLGDVYASGEYRAHLATVLARRALAAAAARAS